MSISWNDFHISDSRRLLETEAKAPQGISDQWLKLPPEIGCRVATNRRRLSLRSGIFATQSE
jgi:hypothetical protein